MPVFLTWEQQQIGELSQITWICHLQIAVFLNYYYIGILLI